MKLEGAVFVSILALLVATVVGECPDLKPTTKEHVEDGNRTHYKVRIAVGSTKFTNATFTVSASNITRR